MAGGAGGMEERLLVGGLLVAGAVLAGRLSARLGVPALLLFLGTGMLAGSDGVGGIWFDDPALTWSAGVGALSLLLFAGGLETHWRVVRPVLAPSLVLATLGVAVSAGLTALFYSWVFGAPLLHGLLLGAIVSSTDAAAVFSVFRASKLTLKGKIQPLLELESGSNDPMAIFLTTTCTALLVAPAGQAGLSITGVAGSLVVQMVVGALAGWLGGKGIAWALNRLRVEQEGLYAVFTTALAAALFGAVSLVGGNGFLAVYVAGIAMGTVAIVHHTTILRVHDALAWVAQIGMFLLLGLLVFPSQLPSVAGEGLILAAFLVLVARPAAVLVSLTPFRVPLREQAMVAWVGLRGAVPIVLATWPRVMGVPGADHLFDLVFFVVVTSVLLQGTTLPLVGRWLGVAEPQAPAPTLGDTTGTRLLTLTVRPEAAGRPLVELELPHGALIAVVERGGESLIPRGSTCLEAGDRVQVVVTPEQEALVRQRLAAEG